MADQEVHNLRMAEVNFLIAELERDIQQLRQNLQDNRYASAAARGRDAHRLEFFLYAIVRVREMARDLEAERANQILASIQEVMARMNMGNGGQGDNGNQNN